jgi:hypothetical protein
MKKLLIIIDPKNGAELSNVRKATIDYPGDRESVKAISDRVFLIEPHKSLGTASALIENALSHHVPIAVFEVEDLVFSTLKDN